VVCQAAGRSRCRAGRAGGWLFPPAPRCGTHPRPCAPSPAPPAAASSTCRQRAPGSSSCWFLRLQLRLHGLSRMAASENEPSSPAWSGPTVLRTDSRSVPELRLGRGATRPMRRRRRPRQCTTTWSWGRAPLGKTAEPAQSQPSLTQCIYTHIYRSKTGNLRLPVAACSPTASPPAVPPTHLIRPPARPPHLQRCFPVPIGVVCHWQGGTRCC
jgi:hypothetical protein